MPFVSYAQNREDAVLWRVLGDYSPGFYIDVGAANPVIDSVTKAFSNAGWRGINIEPMPEPMELLREDRPRDINLQLALAGVPGSQRYFSVKRGNGLSTGIEENATRYRALGWPVAEIEVQVDTLANVCAQFVRDEIHFLKIDVEGSEAAVLAGADFERFRPWIVVIEATAPHVLMTPDSVPLQRPSEPSSPTHESWEPLLISAGYQFVLFDGLNRFYVAIEKAGLFAERLSAPCNVLDDAVSALDIMERDALRVQSAQLSEALRAVNASLLLSEEELAARRIEADVLRSQNEELFDALKSTTETLQMSHDELDGAYQQLFELSRHVSSLAARVHRRETDLAHLEGRVVSAEHHNAEIEANRAAISHQLDAVLSSKAWRITKPLRKIRRLFVRKPNAS
jgi:FkbM family methyltransferase